MSVAARSGIPSSTHSFEVGREGAVVAEQNDEVGMLEVDVLQHP
jgi:hypothetical protein